MENLWEGKTVESAIKTALKDLNCTEQDVDIEVVQEPVKGIFGIVKTAKVKVVQRLREKQVMEHEVSSPPRERPAPRDLVPQDQERGVQAVETLLKLMGIEGTRVTGRIENGSVILDLASGAEGLLIGRHGRTRETLQYIVERIANQNQKEKIKYIVDIGGYLKRHKETLENLAQRAVEKVKTSHHRESLPPMNAFDRRIVHLFLKDHPDVETCSEGEGEARHILVVERRSKAIE